LTILRRLDSERKSTVLQFLYESGLLNERWRELVYQANLSGANLRRAFGRMSLFRGADLSYADLSGAGGVGSPTRS
jgi:uncharacterized protein YjbI with pentapeptide repeats